MRMRWITVPLVPAALAALAALCAPLSARPLPVARPAVPASGLTDTVDVAAPGAEAAHGFASGGAVRRGVAGDVVGGHDMRRVARTVLGAKSWVSYRLRVHPDKPTTLEIEELYGRDTDVHAYTVFVDGRPADFRTFPGSGAGPVHHFVQAPPTGKRSLTVKLVNAGKTPFTVSRIWAFSDFSRYFAADRMEVPYYVAPTLWLSWIDLPGDIARVRQIRESLGKHPNVRPAFTTFIPYASLDDRELSARLDYLLALAEGAGMPVQVEFDTWWANTPDGADGRGGFWTDVPYQQVVYNEDTRAFQLSIPNRWSSTPWLSVSHPALNAFKQQRLAAAMALMRRRYAELVAAGKGDLILAINQDNEPVYWASGNAGLGEDFLLADFNRSALDSAKKEGVTLDPADGLAFAERRWLWRNLLRYNGRIAGGIARGLQDDASIVSAKGTAPPSDQLRFNVYTQAMMMNRASLEYPMLSGAFPLWETAAPKDAQAGPEYNADRPFEREGLMHTIALGRSAGTNAETGEDARNMKSVRPGYALAQRFVALYNYPLDKIDVAASEIRDLSRPFPPLTYLPVLRDVTFRDPSWTREVTSHGGVQTGQIGNTAAIAAFPARSDKPGILTFRLDAPAGGWKGLFLELFGRAKNFSKPDPSVNIRVLAGNGPAREAMTEVGRVHDAGEITEADRLDLSRLAKGNRPVFARLEMNATGLPESVLSWVSVHRVRFTVPWAEMPAPAWKQDVSLRTLRRQNLVVSWRRDAERAIAELAGRVRAGGSPAVTAPGGPEKTGRARLAAARAAYDRGAYASTVRLASAGLSVCLPAAYEVMAPGWLAPYPVRVEAASPVTATVRAWGKDRVALALSARAATPVSVRVAGLAPGQACQLTRAGNAWTLRPDRTGALRADGKGVVTFRATAPAVSIPPVSRTVEGLFRGGTSRAGEVLAYPDAGGRTAFMTGEKTAIRRGEAGAGPQAAILSDLRRGDRITARIGPDGVATDITATTSMAEGAVASFTPMMPYAMPAITLSGGPARVIDLSAPLHLDGKDVVLRTQPVGYAAIAPGNRVRLRFDPVTGRVFELWKPAP